MTGCCVRGCSNSTEKGFSMRAFPADRKRRALWIAKIDIPHWEPSKNNRVCEVHFSEEMWEKVRCDGKRKLKCNAVPTLLLSPSNQSNITDTSLNSQEEEMAKDNSADNETIQNEQQELKVRLTNLGLSATTSIGKRIESENLMEDIRKENEALRKKNEELRKFIKNREKLFDKAITRTARYNELLKKNLKQANVQIQKMKNSQRDESIMRKVFNIDQIQFLTGSNRNGSKWSDETVKRAIRLKFACGSRGYQEILKQNFPFPSERTLRRKLESVKFQDAILESDKSD